MQGHTGYILILSTCPEAGVAGDIAQALVDGKLAACVNIVPGIASRFRWQGRVDQAEEHLLIIKTTRARYPDVEKKIRSMHPYELPEIIAVPVAEGLAEYLDWIAQETK
jgi:periplasmic divalent cation tolerance protein